MKKILLASACAALLSACAAGHTANKQPGPHTTSITTISGQSAKDIADNLEAMPRTDMPTDVNVKMYNTSGAFANPLTTDRNHSILENTTSGGYTVFDESVTVYALPGEGTPEFIPSYAVPPFKDIPAKAEPGLIGKPMGLASAGILPPVKNIEVKSADPFAKPPMSGSARKPLSLTAPEPLSMQPPVSATRGPRSPFLTSADADRSAVPAPTRVSVPIVEPASAPVASAAPWGGRRAPALTGY